MTSFCTVSFYLFFMISVIVYYGAKTQRKQFFVMGIIHFLFLVLVSKKLAVFMILLVGMTYWIARKMEKANKRKLFLVVGIILTFLPLFLSKYLQFAIEVWNRIFPLSLPEFPTISIIGLSFFSFKIVGYLIDVYRNNIKAERNFLRYFLFVSFFPELLTGPIDRSKNLLNQMHEKKEFQYENVKTGLFVFVIGVFFKLVFADRLGILVDTVYGNPAEYQGILIVIATIFYSFQIYGDFLAAYLMAKGISQMLGYTIVPNFDAPYLSQSMQEFWRRWHMSLSSWFKDYVYIPLGGNRKGKIREVLNTIIVFVLSGLWHGASVTFVLWGFMHAIYLVVGKMTKAFRNRILTAKFNINLKSRGFKILRIAFVWCLVTISWLVFRAKSLTVLRQLIQNIPVWNVQKLTDGSLLNLGLDGIDYIISILGIFVFNLYDIFRTKDLIGQVLQHKSIIFRWTVYLVLILVIILFGIYGTQYHAQNFIYTQF